jgi:hypothetical protein
VTQAPHATLARDLTLLRLDPERGKFPSNQHPNLLYSTAQLLDLTGAGRIQISGEGKHAEVVVVDSTPVGDPILDDGLQALEKGIGLGGRKLPKVLDQSSMIRMVRALADAGMVRVEKTKWLGLVPVTRYHPLPASGRDALERRVRQVLLGELVPDRHVGLLASILRQNPRRWVPKEPESDVSSRVGAFFDGDILTDDDRAVWQAMIDAIVAKNETGTV